MTLTLLLLILATVALVAESAMKRTPYIALALTLVFLLVTNLPKR